MGSSEVEAEVEEEGAVDDEEGAKNSGAIVTSEEDATGATDDGSASPIGTPLAGAAIAASAIAKGETRMMKVDARR